MLGKTNAIGGVSEPVPKIRTASGSVISISNALAMPAVSLAVDINAVQDLNGYDKPWPAGGGKNICPPFEKGVLINPTTGDIGSSQTRATTGKIYVDFSQNPNYYLSGMLTTLRNFVASYNSSDQFLGRTAVTTNAATQLTASSFTDGTPQGTGDIAYVRITIYEYSAGSGVIDDIDTMTAQLEIGSSATSYVPYSNICPISGWSEAKVTRTGKNLFDRASIKCGGGSERAFNASISLPAGTYTMSANNVGDCSMGIQFWSSSKNNGTRNFDVGQNSNTITVTDDIVRLYCYISTSNYNNGKYGELTTIQIETGSSATAYEAYQGNTYTIDLDGTRYGGSLNVTTGVLTVDRAIVDLGTLDYTIASSGGISAFRNNIGAKPVSDNTQHGITSIYPFAGTRFIASMPDKSWMIDSSGRFYIRDDTYTTAEGFKLAMNGQQLCYELATPQTVQLTPTQVQMLLGKNVLWANSGDSELQYWARR